jgi:LCP family protein required for cell wall assembly
MTLPLGTQNHIKETDPRPAKTRKRRRGRSVLIAVAAAVLIATLVAGGYLFNLARTFDSNTEKIDSAFPDESTRPQKLQPAAGAKAPVNILVMGSDSRGATEVDAVNGAATDQRADTLILMHIPADRKNVYAISLMRDLWVQIPGQREAKINAALALGGVPLMVQTVESLFSQRVDHVAMVNFEGFKGLTDALGGVDVTVGVPFTSTHGGYTFTAGANRMNGEQALGFVRERYAFTDGDYQRVRNQQAFMKAIFAKALDAQALSNPATITDAVSAVSPFISVDKSLDSATVAGLGLELNSVRQKDVAMFTLPTRGTGTSADGQSIVMTDPAAISKISAALAEDKLGDFVAANNFEKGN